MMQCEIIRDLLPLYAEGLTGDAANREIEAHLAGCDACAKALEQLRVPVEQPEPQAEAWKAAVKKEKKTRRRRLALKKDMSATKRSIFLMDHWKII